MSTNNSPYRDYILKLKDDGYILKPDVDTVVAKRPYNFKAAEIKKDTAGLEKQSPAIEKQRQPIKEIISIPTDKDFTNKTSNNEAYPLRTDTTIITLIILTVFFAYINNYYSRLIKDMVLSARSYTISHRIFSQKNIFRYRGSTLLNIFALLNIGMFAAFAIKSFNISPLPVSLLLLAGIMFIVIFILLFSKIVVYRFLGFIYKSDEITKDYLNNYLLYLKLAGIGLFIINIIIPFIPNKFSQVFIYAGTIGLIIITILQQIRGIIILFRKFVPLFYMILYFCCLEILPWLILIKVLEYQLSG